MKRTVVSLTLGISVALSALSGTAAPAMAATSSESHAVVHVSGKKHYVPGTVRAGSFCAHTKKGWYGYSSKHKLMRCKTGNGDSRLRWRAA
jgi:hypothetical protein